MKPVTVTTFQSDTTFPPVRRAVHAILQRSTVVTPVDVMVEIGWLQPQDLERWRRGEVPYLERVVVANLSKLARFLRVLAFHCHDLDLVARDTAYVRPGSGQPTPLRFTRNGEARLERVYARHFVWPGKGPYPVERLEDAGS